MGSALTTTYTTTKMDCSQRNSSNNHNTFQHGPLESASRKRPRKTMNAFPNA